jgi:hypothetical protein
VECRGLLNLVKVGQNYRALDVKCVSFIVAGDNKLSQKGSLRVRRYKEVRIAEEV